MRISPITLAISLGAILLGTACSSSSTDRANEFKVDKVKAMVADGLSDPDSAKFRRLFISEFEEGKGTATAILSLCGEVNAKNKMGGYVGYHRFVADGKVAFIDENLDENSVEQKAFNTLYSASCSSSIKEVG
ncbi:hypothetical protein [Acidovorax sp. sic0104]|uniref:hypothetical protein n=1 Tax=Acidovorax sp. sic0104 TaxID=2854784 RepID=UPI001C48F6AF|nr:hypothetical protein [Acidovorax sp. sic0104]MBV7542211.1 hypothetical protein [Acidovorax sp. sic0104]